MLQFINSPTVSGPYWYFDFDTFMKHIKNVPMLLANGQVLLITAILLVRLGQWQLSMMAKVSLPEGFANSIRSFVKWVDQKLAH